MDHQNNNSLRYLTQAHAYLLECTLATYTGLCCKSKPPQGELNRHESILKSAFEAAKQDLIAESNLKSGSYFRPEWRVTPRVDEILGYIKAGDTSEEAVCRYINKHRYNVGK